MCIRPANAKSADPSDQGCPRGRRRPGLQGGRDLDGERVPFDVGAGRLEMEMGRQLPMLQGQNGLDQTGNTRRRLQMTDVRLHRANQQWSGSPLGAVTAKDRTQGADLNGVTQGSAGAMRFDITHRRRGDLGRRQRLPDHLLLGALVGHRQPAAGTIMVHGAALDQRQNGVTIALRISQPLEQHNPAPFAAATAIRSRIKTLTAPISSQRPHLRQGNKGEGRQGEIDAAGQRQVTFARAQALTG